MAGKSQYTPEEKARVLVALDANNGNVKRTARETGVAEQTIRNWKKSVAREGVQSEVAAVLPAVQADFAEKTERVRDIMLNNLEAKALNDELSGRDLLMGVGILTDKLRITRGEATSRTEHVDAPASAEEIGAAVQDYLGRAILAAKQRDHDIALSDEDISEATWEQAPRGELPAAT